MVVAHVAKIPKQADARMWQERGGEAVIFLVRKCLSAVQLRPSAPLEGDNEHPWSPALPTTRPVGQLISYIYLLIISSPDCIEEVANGYWCSSLVS